MSRKSLRRTFYGAIIFLWIITMSMLVHRHYGAHTEKTGLTSEFPADLADKAAIPFNLKLPGIITFLKVSISGIDLSQFDISGGRQQLNGSTLTVVSDTPANGAITDMPFLRSTYLQESFSVKSKDPGTIALARKIAGNEADPLRAAHNIHDWVYRNIDKVRTISIPVSTEVLKTRKGDCNEHAVVFTALARAAGVPSRIVLGLVYGDGFLYYHSWSEVLTDRWIAIDPTLGQFPADASHIRLIAGDIDKQAAIMSLIGKIKIEGLEYR